MVEFNNLVMLGKLANISPFLDKDSLEPIEVLTLSAGAITLELNH